MAEDSENQKPAEANAPAPEEPKTEVSSNETPAAATPETQSTDVAAPEAPAAAPEGAAEQPAATAEPAPAAVPAKKEPKPKAAKKKKAEAPAAEAPKENLSLDPNDVREAEDHQSEREQEHLLRFRSRALYF